MSLTPQQVSRLSALLDSALERAASERDGWLLTLAGEDAVVLAALQRALDVDLDPTGDPVAAPASDTSASADRAAGYWLRSGRLSSLGPESIDGSGRQAAAGSAPPPGPGMQLGGYRLLRPLGQGGMASVWLAERIEGDIDRPVAVKVPLAVSGSRKLGERFARERDVLARLAHPHVATLYDAGVTADAIPFLALEYVDGEPITRYCDAAKLSVDARVLLFGQVLDAVQYAHARLVIHRDIKPSNVLVTRDGTVKLLDFGIAKLIAPEDASVDDARRSSDDLTLEVGVAVTPNYASPEQLAGEPLTVATDVYSLGVLLYELLTGSRPYSLKRDRQAALAQAVLAAEIAAPSRAKLGGGAAAAHGTTEPKLRRTLRGDLDAILIKALEREPCSRYPTVAEFAADLGRYRRNEPVAAAPAGTAYRLRKYVIRHRIAVAATAAVVIATLAGTAVAVWQLRETQRELARRNTVQGFLVGMFKTADPEVARGRVYTAKDLLDHGAQRIDSTFAAQPEIAAALYGEVGAIYSAIGDLKSAREYLRRKAALLETLGQATTPDYADALIRHGRYALQQDLFEEAERVLRQAIAVAARIGAAAHVQRWEAMVTLAEALERLSRYSETADLLAAVRRELAAARPGAVPAELAWLVEERSGQLVMGQGQYEEALRHFESVIALQTLDPALERVDALRAQQNVAVAEIALRRFDVVKEMLTPLLGELDTAFGRQAPDTLRIKTELARALIGLGRYDEALKLQSAVIDDARASGSVAQTRRAEIFVIRALMGVGRYDEAATLADVTTAYFAAQSATRIAERQRVLKAEIDVERGNFGAALEQAQRALDAQTALFGADSLHLGHTLDVIGAARRGAGDIEAAATAHQRALDIHRIQFGPEHVFTLRSALYLALDEITLGRDGAAERFAAARASLSALMAGHPALNQIALAALAADRAARIKSSGRAPGIDLPPDRFRLIDL